MEYVYRAEHCGTMAGRVTGPLATAEERDEIDPETDELYHDYATMSVDDAKWYMQASAAQCGGAPRQVFLQRAAREILRREDILNI